MLQFMLGQNPTWLRRVGDGASCVGAVVILIKEQ